MTRSLSLVNGVQQRSSTYCSSVNHTRWREKEEKKWDDCMMMVVELRKRKDRRKKRWRDRCQVNDLEHILSESKRAHWWWSIWNLWLLLLFFYRSPYMYTYMVSVYSIRKNSNSFDIMTLFKINLLVKNSTLKIMSYTRYLFTSVFYQGRSEQDKEWEYLTFRCSHTERSHSRKQKKEREQQLSLTNTNEQRSIDRSIYLPKEKR